MLLVAADALALAPIRFSGFRTIGSIYRMLTVATVALYFLISASGFRRDVFQHRSRHKYINSLLLSYASQLI